MAKRRRGKGAGARGGRGRGRGKGEQPALVLAKEKDETEVGAVTAVAVNSDPEVIEIEMTSAVIPAATDTKNATPVCIAEPVAVLSPVRIARNASTGCGGIPEVIEKRSAEIPITPRVSTDKTAASACKTGNTEKCNQPIFKKPYDIIHPKVRVDQTVAATPIGKDTVNGEAKKPPSNPFHLIGNRNREIKSDTGKKVKKMRKELKHLGIPKKVKKSLTSFLGDKEKYNIEEMVREVNLGLKSGETEDKFCSLGSIHRCPPILGKMIWPFQPGQLSGFRLFHNQPINIARPDSDTVYENRKDVDGEFKAPVGVPRKKFKSDRDRKQ